MKFNTNRYEALDAARGILALLIVWQHVRYFVNGGESWLDKSQLVVNVFFALAGFSFGLSKPRPYGEYITAKVRRLFPIYLVALGFAFVLGGGQHWLELLIDATGLQGLIPCVLWRGDEILPVAWFVTCILQLYLVAPFFARLKSGPLWIAFGISMLVLTHPINWRLYVMYSNFGGFGAQKLYLFLGGMLLFRYWPKFGDWRVLLPLRPLLWFGEISYALFLLHYPILASVWQANPSLAALLLAGVPMSILASYFVPLALRGGKILCLEWAGKELA